MNVRINKFNKKTESKTKIQKNIGRFWILLTKKKKKKKKKRKIEKESNNINLDVLYNFFEDLNATEVLTDEADINIHVDEEGDETLNSYITENEIFKCIELLKNNKGLLEWSDH